MNFITIMQNLAIGIIGGIFSSILISVVFYVLSQFQNELNKAKDMTFPLYGIIVLKGIKNKPKTFPCEDMALKYWGDAMREFQRFEPWQFKYELREVMCNVQEVLQNGRYHNNGKALIEDANKIEGILDKLDKCERDFAKLFIKRLLRNRIIIVMMVICLSIIIVA